MKVLLVNGSPHKEGCTYTALTEVEKELNAAGVETEMIWLGVKPISGCLGCGACCRRGPNGEPASLRCFNEAVDAADTSSLDCNYAQMGDIYGQIARIYDNHAMPDSAIRAYELAENYARKANDTISVITIWGNKSNALIDLGQISEALELREKASERFKALGYPKKAARVKGLCIKWYIQQGELDKAKAAIDEYEAISGYSRIKGEAKSGWESFFHIKGTYYLETGKPDSANYYFNKLKLAGDTLFNIQAAQKLQNAQTMYNYMRHQEAAHRKELESKNVQLRLYRYIAFSRPGSLLLVEPLVSLL